MATSRRLGSCLRRPGKQRARCGTVGRWDGRTDSGRTRRTHHGDSENLRDHPRLPPSRPLVGAISRNSVVITNENGVHTGLPDSIQLISWDIAIPIVELAGNGMRPSPGNARLGRPARCMVGPGPSSDRERGLSSGETRRHRTAPSALLASDWTIRPSEMQRYPTPKSPAVVGTPARYTHAGEGRCSS
jgi:hypothetical protein